MGRHGWFDEMMRFYDRYLKGTRRRRCRTRRSRCETSDGKWRSETRGRRPTRSRHDAALQPGTYTDDAQNNGTADGGTAATAQGVWTFSPPLAHDAHLAGVPKVTVDASTDAARTPTSSADVYDIDANGNATLDQPRHLPARRRGPDPLRPVRQRLEAARRSPPRRAAHRRRTPSGGCTGRRSSRSPSARLDLAAVALVRARRRHRGRSLDQARHLQGRRAVRGARSDDRRGDRPIVRAARSTGRVQLTS